MQGVEELLERIRQKINERYGKTPKYTVLCLGNPVMGDDATGYIVAKRLEEKGLGEKVVYAGTNPLDFLGRLRRGEAELIIVVDSVQAGLRPGDVIVDWLENVKEAGTLATTHSIPLQALERIIGKRMLLIGVQGSVYEAGAGPTAPTARSATYVAVALEKLAKQKSGKGGV